MVGWSIASQGVRDFFQQPGFREVDLMVTAAELTGHAVGRKPPRRTSVSPKATEKVSGGSARTSRASATTQLESTPPLRKMPRGTSLTKRCDTASRRCWRMTLSASSRRTRGRRPGRHLGKAPVSLDPALAFFPGQGVAGGQRTHTLNDGERVLHRSEGQVGSQPRRVQAARHQARGEQGSNFRPEDEQPRACVIVERLFSQAVAGQEKALLAGIPDGEGEHANQLAPSRPRPIARRL